MSQKRLWELESNIVPLAHGVDFFGLDLVGYADFAGLTEGIDRIAEIFLRELVDVVVGAGFSDFHDLAADFEVAVGIGGILKRNGNARIAADIFVFHAALGGINADELAVVVHPYGSDLRAAVFHQRS